MSVLVMAPIILSPSSTGTNLWFCSIIDVSTSDMGALGEVVMASVVAKSMHLDFPKPWKIAFSTTSLDKIPMYLSFLTTGRTFTPYLVIMSSASFTALLYRTTTTGAVMTSCADFRGLTYFLNASRSFSSTISKGTSFIVAEAAVGCPPPPKSDKTCDTLSSTTLLLATIRILSAIAIKSTMASVSSISIILWARCATSPKPSIVPFPIFMRTPRITISLRDCTSSLRSTNSSLLSSIFKKFETILRFAPLFSR
ncbi:MAG: hypothetical protein DDT31_01841 [Syntrophomonadaceae bacterium]|nr:hypothetical protein [Bacillota bacterium]